MEDILCVTGYGPQIGDTVERKHAFWDYLDREVEHANNENKGLIIQIDSNCWAGNKVIPFLPTLKMEMANYWKCSSVDINT